MSGPNAVARLLHSASQGFTRTQSMLFDLAQRKYNREAIASAATDFYKAAADPNAPIEDVAKVGTGSIMRLEMLGTPEAFKLADSIKSNLTLRNQMEADTPGKLYARGKVEEAGKLQTLLQGDQSTTTIRDIHNTESGRDEVTAFNFQKGSSTPRSKTVIGVAPEPPFTSPGVHAENLKTDAVNAYSTLKGQINTAVTQVGGLENFKSTMKYIRSKPDLKAAFEDESQTTKDLMNVFLDKADPSTLANFGEMRAIVKNINKLGGVKQQLKEVYKVNKTDEFDEFTSPVAKEKPTATTDESNPWITKTLKNGKTVRMRKLPVE